MEAHGLAMGINYKGSSMELNGCLHDAGMWSGRMKAKKFASVTLIEETAATKAAMVAALKETLSKCPPKGLCVLTYSGHGTIVPPGNQAWVPYDFDWKKPDTWLTYDEIDRMLIQYEQAGVRVVIISDSCHSAADPRRHMRSMNAHPTRFRYLPPPPDMVARTVGYPFGRNVVTADQDDILLAGCRKEQTSADAYIDGRYWGAFSYACDRALTKDPALSYQGAVLQARAYLAREGYDQVPQACGDPGALEHGFFAL